MTGTPVGLTPFDAERAREAGLRSGEARRRKSRMTPEERVREAIAKRAGELVGELLKAAFGEGEFEDLKADLRLAAIKTALEYGVGKPTVQRREESEPERVPTPADLFAEQTSIE